MLKQRIITALILAPAVLAAILYLPNLWLSALVALIMVFAQGELARLAGVESTTGLIPGMLFVLAPIAALWYWPDSQIPALQLGALLWLISFAWLAASQRGRARQGQWRLLKLVLSYVMTIPAWLALTRLHAIHPAWLICLLFLVWGADVGAYAAGRTLGRHKLAPSISPGKTWEGLVGGLITAVLVVFIAAVWGGEYRQPWLLLLITAVIALISVGGDLLVSLLKRHAGSKDTGHLLPGHGGIMDRIDSLCAAAPFFALAAIYWRDGI